MRLSIVASFVAALCGLVGVSDCSHAQSAPNSVALRPSTPADSAAAEKFTFLLFSKENNANTQRITGELTAALATRGDRTQWQALNITDPANREIVERYQLGRVPMPLVLCVAPNGAITGVMPGKVTEKAVEASLVSPTMTRCMKSLQAEKLVVVHLQNDASQPLPTGATEFLADPAFKDRTVTESFVISDPNEARFLRDMKLDASTVSSVSVVLLAPPGTLVGKFPATATGADIAAKLHAAGKCCNDPNCKHNRQAQ
jgi:hypothetical protein